MGMWMGLGLGLGPGLELRLELELGLGLQPIRRYSAVPAGPLNLHGYLVPGDCYLLPGACHLVPGTHYLLPGTWHLVPSFVLVRPREGGHRLEPDSDLDSGKLAARPDPDNIGFDPELGLNPGWAVSIRTFALIRAAR